MPQHITPISTVDMSPADAQRILIEHLDAFIDSGPLLFVPLGHSAVPARVGWPDSMSGVALEQQGGALRWLYERDWPTGLRESLSALAVDAAVAPPPQPDSFTVCHPGPRASTVARLRHVVRSRDMLLAWLGGRDQGLSPDEYGLVAALLRPLRRRMMLERGAAMSWIAVALFAALEAQPEPAYLVDSAYEVIDVNQAAVNRRGRDRARVLSLVDRCGGLTDDDSFRTIPLAATGPSPRYLVVGRPHLAPMTRRIESAADRWQLTARQRLVFDLLCQGYSNKEISVQLRCAENTVEAHVTQILAKAGVDRRSSLLARLWQEL